MPVLASCLACTSAAEATSSSFRGTCDGTSCPAWPHRAGRQAGSAAWRMQCTTRSSLRGGTRRARPVPPMTCIPACRCERISREFFEQGDAERAAGLPVSRGCDRSSTDIASSQVPRPPPPARRSAAVAALGAGSLAELQARRPILIELLGSTQLPRAMRACAAGTAAITASGAGHCRREHHLIGPHPCLVTAVACAIRVQLYRDFECSFCYSDQI